MRVRTHVYVLRVSKFKMIKSKEFLMKLLKYRLLRSEEGLRVPQSGFREGGRYTWHLRSLLVVARLAQGDLGDRVRGIGRDGPMR